jgi:predicted dinucleotide-binding enzyme
MRIGVLGTGIVGRTLAGALVGGGHEVRMGSRTAGNEHAVAWVAETGAGASEGTFADAAGFGEVLINATSGSNSPAVLEAAGAELLGDKVLIDVSNPLDFSTGALTLSVCNDDSVGERLQRAYPDLRVVKALNTVTAALMVQPSLVAGTHTIFLCGDDAGAKAQVAELLQGFGWPAASLLDLGDITGARAMEMYLPLWMRLYGAKGTPVLNVEVRAADDGD